MDNNSIFTKRYTDNEKEDIKIKRTCVWYYNKNENDKLHILFYYMDAYLRCTENGYITFKNFQILIKRYLERFLNNKDMYNFLKIFNKDYFFKLLITKKNKEKDILLTLYNNINFLSLFCGRYLMDDYDKISLKANFSNVIDFLIENEHLFHSKRDGVENVLKNMEDITSKIKKFDLDN